MVKAMIDITKEANQVLNIIKARYNLRTKSEAINKLALSYAEEFLEPKLRPEFIAKMKKQQKEPAIKIGSLKDFKRRYGMK